MENINSFRPGVEELIKGLKVHKAMGPDEISCHFPKEPRSVTASLLQTIFQCSLDTGETPQDWREADVAPLFKKGER